MSKVQVWWNPKELSTRCEVDCDFYYSKLVVWDTPLRFICIGQFIISFARVFLWQFLMHLRLFVHMVRLQSILIHIGITHCNCTWMGMEPIHVWHRTQNLHWTVSLTSTQHIFLITVTFTKNSHRVNEPLVFKWWDCNKFTKLQTAH